MDDNQRFDLIEQLCDTRDALKDYKKDYDYVQSLIDHLREVILNFEFYVGEFKD